METYLTTKELGKRIKMAPGTIRNLVWKKEFKRNIHYVKPSPKKLLFIWSTIEKWLHGESVSTLGENSSKGKDQSLINI